MAEWSGALDIRLSDWCLQCINGVSSNPVEGKTNICQLKDLILTLFGLIFRRIYIYINAGSVVVVIALQLPMLSSLTEFESRSSRGVLDTTLFDQVCQ